MMIVDNMIDNMID